MNDEVMSFSEALICLKKGEKVSRRGWNGPGQFIEMQVPNELSKMKSPYLFISPVSGLLVPWVASQTDLLSEDWYVLDGMSEKTLTIDELPSNRP